MEGGTDPESGWESGGRPRIRVGEWRGGADPELGWEIGWNSSKIKEVSAWGNRASNPPPDQLALRWVTILQLKYIRVIVIILQFYSYKGLPAACSCTGWV